MEVQKLDVTKPIYIAANSRPLELLAPLPNGEGYIVRVKGDAKNHKMTIVDRYGAVDGKPYATNAKATLTPIGAAQPHYAPLVEGQEVWRFAFTRRLGKCAFVRCTVLAPSSKGIVAVTGKRPGKIVKSMRSHIFETADACREWIASQTTAELPK